MTRDELITALAPVYRTAYQKNYLPEEKGHGFHDGFIAALNAIGIAENEVYHVAFAEEVNAKWKAWREKQAAERAKEADPNNPT